MSGHDELDFLGAFGEELCDALSPPVPFDMIAPQDAFEVWTRAFGTQPTPEALATLAATEFEQLHKTCIVCFECPDVAESQIRLAVTRTLLRWPAQGL